tara:strand:- start:148 stop:654 length:507 start_codon:yes stop_codon:yes gene_type:complete
MIRINVGGPQATVDLQARKTLEGNLLIMDHDIIDIVLLPENSKVMAFPKSQSVEDAYNTQARLFDFLADKGIVDRETVQGGNIFNSLEAVIPESKQANGLQAAVYVISEFIADEADVLQSAEQYEKNLEDYFVDPTDQDSTELGEVPQQAEKGAMVPGYYYIPLRYKM